MTLSAPSSQKNLSLVSHNQAEVVSERCALPVSVRLISDKLFDQRQNRLIIEIGRRWGVPYSEEGVCLEALRIVARKARRQNTTPAVPSISSPVWVMRWIGGSCEPVVTNHNDLAHVLSVKDINDIGRHRTELEQRSVRRLIRLARSQQIGDDQCEARLLEGVDLVPPVVRS